LTFTDFVLAHLPPPPGRVLEVGCGEEGGVTPALAAAGYDALGIDPRAPVGPCYRSVSLAELDDPGPFEAVVCGRVLHHVNPLGPALDKLARLAPLLVVDEFSHERIDERAREWYESQHRILTLAGREPKGPPDLGEWRWRHPDLHTLDTVKRELDVRYRARVLEPRPYLYRWLRGPSSEELERGLIEAGAIQPIGWRYVGERLGDPSPT
jgi:hypothetical protein